MARNNYQYEKRQKDLAKKKKQEEKRLKKLNKTSPANAEEPTESQTGNDPATSPEVF